MRLVGPLALGLCVLVGAVSCSTDSRSEDTSTGIQSDVADAAPGTDPVTTLAAARPYGYEVLTETFVDTSRQTPAGASTPAAPERTLETRIYLPDATGSLPLIVFAHGISGHPDKFTGLFATWAEAGYVVVAPVFPLTNDQTPGSALNFTDAANQPADMSFVLDEVLELSAAAEGPLAGKIDGGRLGAAGLSLGGLTTYTMALSECCRDDRAVAVEIFAGTTPNMGEGEEFTAVEGVPTLVFHGTGDPWIPYQTGGEAFELLNPPAYLVTLEGAGHSEPFEDSESPFDDFVEAISLAFWDQFLLTSEENAEVLFEQVEAFDSATITAAG
ncbi:MAG: hypothetical protein JJLCMIEE_03116 [Acidimicrobiales bacterium]|nr:MAG: hypothetical protein EDR02_15215 [Actinomycetota bacterium]MBV6509997.1 hypothetical protein [Acidimicrobiales bacterium]RIK04312.1 MAG: hypothetical protein DCC48_13805 [Acidobacteriota bacterium]